jgi:NADH-quinone oxidoreductase subunit F
MLSKAADGKLKIDRELFTDLITTMEIGSLCALGGGLPLPVRNAMKYFDVELKQYFEN